MVAFVETFVAWLKAHRKRKTLVAVVQFGRTHIEVAPAADIEAVADTPEVVPEAEDEYSARLTAVVRGCTVELVVADALRSEEADLSNPVLAEFHSQMDLVEGEGRMERRG